MIRVHFLLALCVAMSATLMSFEFKSFSDTHEIFEDYWIEPIEQDTMIVIKYEKVPELPKPKKPESSPRPEPDPKPEPKKLIDLSKLTAAIDSIDWFGEEESDATDPIYIPTLSFASEMPLAPDCMDQHCTESYMMRHFARNLSYPKRPKDLGISGTVYVDFVIDENGRIVDVQARNSIHPDLEKEAIRVVSSLGRFSPGKQGDKKVRIQYTAPISFNLGL